MAEPKTNELMEKIVSLCKRKGLVFQSSEIYGGINGFWDYGPLGADLKRNVKELWWNAMTRFRDDVVGLEATIIMDPQIWKASGHVETFVDMMVEDPLTNRRYRVDQVEAQNGIVYYFSGASNMIPSEFGFVADEKEMVEKYLKQKRELEDLKKLGEAFLASSDPKERKIAPALLEFVSLKNQIKEPFSVLLPAGKPPESAFVVAGEYYEKEAWIALGQLNLTQKK